MRVRYFDDDATFFDINSTVHTHSVWTDPQSGEKFDLQRMARGRGWVVKSERENMITSKRDKCCVLHAFAQVAFHGDLLRLSLLAIDVG